MNHKITPTNIKSINLKNLKEIKKESSKIKNKKQSSNNINNINISLSASPANIFSQTTNIKVLINNIICNKNKKSPQLLQNIHVTKDSLPITNKNNKEIKEFSSNLCDSTLNMNYQNDNKTSFSIKPLKKLIETKQEIKQKDKVLNSYASQILKDKTNKIYSKISPVNDSLPSSSLTNTINNRKSNNSNLSNDAKSKIKLQSVLDKIKQANNKYDRILDEASFASKDKKVKIDPNIKGNSISEKLLDSFEISKSFHNDKSKQNIPYKKSENGSLISAESLFYSDSQNNKTSSINKLNSSDNNSTNSILSTNKLKDTTIYTLSDDEKMDEINGKFNQEEFDKFYSEINKKLNKKK